MNSIAARTPRRVRTHADHVTVPDPARHAQPARGRQLILERQRLARRHDVGVESGLAAIFVVVAAAAVTGSPWLLVLGLMGHGLKDLPH